MPAATDAENPRALAILATIAAIPSGKVSTYGDIAKQAGYPGLARYVARLLSQLPSATKIPWHRVVNSRRKISFSSTSNAYHEQANRLKEEGIEINASGIIPLHFFQYKQP